MGQIVDIGRRIELVAMDRYFHDISISLYQQQWEDVPAFCVHTYSRIEGAQQRIEFVVKAMQTLGGMELTPDGRLKFPCGADHKLACKRCFLEACKLDSNEAIEPRPLNTLDKRSGRHITVSSLGSGVYQVAADAQGKRVERRIAAIAGGLIKLGNMVAVGKSLDKVALPCGHSHDALVGLLLVRAPNVRAVVREQETAASRGVLSSPSQQK